MAEPSFIFIDGSKLMIEAMAKAGLGAYMGYPITPVNRLFDSAQNRIPIALEAPDEITALQWSAGFSSTGIIPATASAFPGFALMIESLNMAFMMELPMVIILAQRLGPSTGSATTGGQGDLLLLRGCVSGGYSIPVFCPSNLTDCWDLAAASVHTSVKLRSPVVLLTSKEMIMTNRNIDTTKLKEIHPSQYDTYQDNGDYLPYNAGAKLTPPFLPVGNKLYQVRLNASTHNKAGITEKNTNDALKNTERLKNKIDQGIESYTFFDYDQDEQAEIVILTYGISTEATKDAINMLRVTGESISLLVMKTLLPVPPSIYKILSKYKYLLVVEENISGLLRELLYGNQISEYIRGVNKIGDMITPQEIIKGVKQCRIKS